MFDPGFSQRKKEKALDMVDFLQAISTSDTSGTALKCFDRKYVDHILRSSINSLLCCGFDTALISLVIAQLSQGFT